jgi:hypothetical protein
MMNGRHVLARRHRLSKPQELQKNLNHQIMLRLTIKANLFH